MTRGAEVRATHALMSMLTGGRHQRLFNASLAVHRRHSATQELRPAAHSLSRPRRSLRIWAALPSEILYTGIVVIDPLAPM
jgi:hypothetical protein